MTVIEALGLAFSVVQMTSSIGGASPSQETQGRITAAYDLAIEQLRSDVKTWSRLDPIDESFLARESNWQLVIESALGTRTLSVEDLDLSRFDGKAMDDPELANAFLGAFSTALSRDALMSTLVTVKQTADVVERTLGRAPTRGEVLDSLLLGSRHRLTAGLIAAGLPPDDASRLALALPVHRSLPGDVLAPSTTRVLTAPVGAGKSVLANLAFQAQIQAAQADSTRAVVWLDARTMGDGDLLTQVQQQTTSLGCRLPCPLAVIVDGLDELHLGLAVTILNEARALAASQNAGVLLTTRPLPLDVQPYERVELPSLSEAETLSLVSLAAGRDVRDWHMYSWPASIREAASLPLFALLTGAWLKAHPFVPTTTSELVEHLVSRALNGQRSPDDNRERWLMMLASASTSCGGSVALRDLPHNGDLGKLIESGMIQVVDGQAEFVLALLREWFAARALITGAAPIDAAVGTSDALSRWREALRALLGMASTDFVHEVLQRAVSIDPGLVGSLLQSGASRVIGGGQAPTLPDSLQAGTLVREAMVALHDSLGELGDYVVPTDEAGDVVPIGALADGTRLSIAWLLRPPATGRVVAMRAEDLRLGAASMPRRRMMTATPSSSPAWPWVWAHDATRDSLTDLLLSGYPMSPDGPLVEEATWAIANRLVRGRQLERMITTDELLSALGDLYDELSDDCEFAGFPSGLEEPLRILRPRLQQLRELGIGEIRAPWPQPDIRPPEGPSAWVWDFFSPEQLRLRTQAVYEGALTAYEHLSHGPFLALSGHLAVRRLLPARLQLYMRLAEGSWRGPSAEWHLLPLPTGSQNEVVVDIVEEAPTPETLFAEARAAAASRPELADASLGVHGTILDIFGMRPMTQICYQWLADDLARIHWVKELHQVHL